MKQGNKSKKQFKETFNKKHSKNKQSRRKDKLTALEKQKVTVFPRSDESWCWQSDFNLESYRSVHPEDVLLTDTWMQTDFDEVHHESK